MGYVVHALLLVVGLAVGLPSFAVAEQEVKTTYGKTWITVSDPHIKVRVDEHGKIASITDGQVQVRHLDQWDFCRKVDYVWVRWLMSPNDAAPLGRADLRLCNFNYNDATVPIGIGYSVPRAEAVLAPFCKGPERTKGWTGRVPFYRLQVLLEYNAYLGSAVDPLLDVEGVAELTCDRVPCTPLHFWSFENGDYNPITPARVNTPYEMSLFWGGRDVEVTPTNLPPGMTLDKIGRLQGVVPPYAAGRYKISYQVKDSCPWNSGTRGGTVTLEVRDDTPPKVISLSPSSSVLSQQGGEVTVTVKASDNSGVQSGQLLRKAADGKEYAVAQMQMVAGSATDGEWRGTWTVPGNSSSTPRTEQFGVRLEDVDGNVTKTPAGSGWITVQVAGRDTVAPSLGAVTLTPTALPSQGGEVALSVPASDNIGIARVMVTQVWPDGRQTNGVVPLASGTPTSGDWRIAWRIGGSSGSIAETYTIKVKANDAAGNSVDGQPILVTVAGRTASSSPPIAGPGSQGQPPQPGSPTHPVPHAARVGGAPGTAGAPAQQGVQPAPAAPAGSQVQGLQAPPATRLQQGQQAAQTARRPDAAVGAGYGAAAVPAGSPQAGWWVRGAGPQDTALAQAIQGRLQQQGGSPWGRVAGSVGVEVANGAVRLTGKLTSPQHREAIEGLVRGTQGVRAVTNAIVVGP